MWQCECVSNQNHVEKGNVKAYPCDVTFAISIIDIHEDIIRFLVRTLRLAKELILVDRSCLILGAFEPTLRFWQGWSDVSSSPLEPWLLNTHPSLKDNLVTIPPPAYARTCLRFDLTDVLRDSQSMSFTNGEDFDQAQFYRSTILDVSQADALLHSLQHVVALIHGPPGTGKSFAVSGIVRVLAKAMLSADLGLVVCVSHTNHALDQLLEPLSGYKLGVVRVGSHSRSEILDAWDLKRLVHDKEVSSGSGLGD